jgi:hypothetical protein
MPNLIKELTKTVCLVSILSIHTYGAFELGQFSQRQDDYYKNIKIVK